MPRRPTPRPTPSRHRKLCNGRGMSDPYGPAVERNYYSDGIVLVFDMDQTLIHNRDNIITNISFNPRAIQFLQKAIASPKLTAILLLTNNSDRNFIIKVDRLLEENVGERFVSNSDHYFFDAIMDLGDTFRPDGDPFRNINGSSDKTLAQVNTMLKRIGLSTTNSNRRVFFFDDLYTHKLCKELYPSTQFIQITPPFYTDVEGYHDTTDYSGVCTALGIEDISFAPNTEYISPLTPTAGNASPLQPAAGGRRRRTRRKHGKHVKSRRAKKSSRRRISPKF